MNECNYSWQYENNPITEIDPRYIGFVYIITNIIDNRCYYGKKKLFFTRTAMKTITLKSGIKKKKKIKKEVNSDWITYYGSNAELNVDVQKHGPENFTRTILRFCSTLSEMSYYELKYQIESDCLLYPDRYYNSWISARVRRSHLVK